jgi:hypothetical protein
MIPASASASADMEPQRLVAAARAVRLGESYRRRTAVGDRARLGARA